MEGKFLKHISTNLYFTKYIEINIRHSDVQRRVSYKNGMNIRVQDQAKDF